MSTGKGKGRGSWIGDLTGTFQGTRKMWEFLCVRTVSLEWLEWGHGEWRELISSS